MANQELKIGENTIIRIERGYGCSSESGYIKTVNFSKPFEHNPIVLLTPVFTGSGFAMSANVISVSTTGFTYRVTWCKAGSPPPQASDTAGEYANWIAIGV